MILYIYIFFYKLMYFQGFTIANGIPKVGQLLGAAWNLDSTYRFKILPAGTHLSSVNTEKRETNGNNGNINKTNHKETADRLDMPPPPSPASSTCSDTGSITTSHSNITSLFILIYYLNYLL